MTELTPNSVSDRKGLEAWIDPLRSISQPKWVAEKTAAQQARTPYLGAGDEACRGFEKRKLDDETFHIIRRSYESVRGELQPERSDAIGRFVESIWPGEPPALYFEKEGVNALVLKLLKPLHEQWCGFPLAPAACYGFRVYLRGAYLHGHVDRGETHVISSTICVDKDVYAPWLLQAVDIDGNSFDVDLEPGEHVLYESAKIQHGRPMPLNGRFHVGMFVHYKPAEDADLWATSPQAWYDKHRA